MKIGKLKYIFIKIYFLKYYNIIKRSIYLNVYKYCPKVLKQYLHIKGTWAILNAIECVFCKMMMDKWQGLWDQIETGGKPKGQNVIWSIYEWLC